MTVTLTLSVLLAAAQASTSVPGPEPEMTEHKQVAFEELSSGRSAQAIVMLEASLREEPDDPATLINLGTAYASQGDAVRAARAFRAALTSDTRYRLELADGSWVDSRLAARRALEGLEGSLALAALSE